MVLTVYAAVRANPQLDLGLDGTAVGRGEDVLHTLCVRGHREGLERLAALNANVSLLVGRPQVLLHRLPARGRRGILLHEDGRRALAADRRPRDDRGPGIQAERGDCDCGEHCYLSSVEDLEEVRLELDEIARQSLPVVIK